MKDKDCFGIKKMNLHIKDNGKQENLMEMEKKLSQGLGFMKVGFWMGLNQEKVEWNGMMVDYIKEISMKVICMGKVDLLKKMEYIKVNFHETIK